MEPLFPSLAKVIAGLGPDHVGRRAIVFAAWRKAAGQAIAARTEPVELDGIRLIVNVADEAWVSHLKALAPEMLAKINALVGQGTVTLIDFRSTEAST
jgi:predicted nucleic acid-binding Zn ribbon protein